MKNLFTVVIASFVFAGSGLAEQSKEITSLDLITKIMNINTGLFGLNTDCELRISSSSLAEEFAAITLKNDSKSVTLKLKSPGGKLKEIRSGNSAYHTAIFKTKTAELSYTTFEDIADVKFSLREGDEQIDCRFEE